MGVREVVERLGSADVGSMSVAEVTAAMRNVARVESWAAGVAARLASRADDLAASGDGASGAKVSKAFSTTHPIS